MIAFLPPGSILIHLGSWNVILSEVGRSLGAFWEDFELDLELFWMPKVIKTAPKSISKTYRVLRPNFWWFLMNSGRSDHTKSTKNNWFSHVIVKFAILLQVGPRDQKLIDIVPQK